MIAVAGIFQCLGSTVHVEHRYDVELNLLSLANAFMMLVDAVIL